MDEYDYHQMDKQTSLWLRETEERQALLAARREIIPLSAPFRMNDWIVLSRPGRYDPIGEGHPAIGFPCYVCLQKLTKGDTPAFVTSLEDIWELVDEWTIDAYIAHEECAHPWTRKQERGQMMLPLSTILLEEMEQE